MPERPPQPYTVIPDGWEVVAEPDPQSRTVTGKRCRRKTGKHTMCPQPAVMEFARSHITSYAKPDLRRRTRWWAYCADHMYGRWIEDGQVMHWRLRKIDA